MVLVTGSGPRLGSFLQAHTPPPPSRAAGPPAHSCSGLRYLQGGQVLWLLTTRRYIPIYRWETEAHGNNMPGFLQAVGN